MKTNTLPLYRDGSRLMVFDPSRPRKTRQQRFHVGRRAWRSMVWGQAAGWNYREVDLERLDNSPVAAAWCRLPERGPVDADSLADVLFILLETPAVETFSAEETDVDLRLLLCDRRKTRRFLIENSCLWAEALEILEGKGLIEAKLRSLLLREVPTPDRCIDPFSFSRFGFSQDILELSWSEFQVRSFLPFLQGGRVRQVRQLDRLIPLFRKEDEKGLRRLQHFLLTSTGRFSTDWIVFASHFKKQQDRLAFLDLLPREKADEIAARKIPLEVVHLIRDRADRHGLRKIDIQPCWVYHSTHLNLRFLGDLYRLAGFLGLLSLPPIGSRKVVHNPDTTPYKQLAGKIWKREPAGGRESPQLGSRLVFRLFARAARRKLFAQIIDEAPWEALCSDDFRDWLWILDRFDRCTRDDETLRELCDRFTQSVAETPSQARTRYLDYFFDIADYWYRRPSDVLFSSTVAFSRRAAVSFAKKQENLTTVFLSFVESRLTNQIWALGDVPRSALKQFERRGRSYSAMDRFEAGLKSLFRILPGIDTGLLLLRPAHYFRAVESLGTVRETDREQILLFLKDHPAFGFDPRRIELSDAAILCPERMPPELLLHKDGQTLREDRLSYYRNQFCSEVATYRLQILESELERVRQIRGGNHLDPHTIRFVNAMGRINRRALKNYLHAATTRDVSQYRERHPLNRAWIQKHPNLALDRWIAGGSDNFPPQILGHGDCFVRFEENAEEELKMGTYVGSCLSTGGCNASSAVTNTLDINKRVAYLRDQQGKVIARQLLAISEEEKLVPFSVYHAQHQESRQSVEDCFVRFDAWLATDLGIALWKAEEDYSIPALVGHDWYDDGPWDRPGKLYAHRFSDNTSAIVAG